MKKVEAIHFILIAGLIHGLLYVFLLPPWQHYDEPGHFEVAWLIANRPGLPMAGEYDLGMRREVAASMIERGFFKDISEWPNLLAQNDPIWIGISQTDNPPLYYWLAALPIRLVPTSDVTFQLYICRFVSLLLYLLTILTASGIVSEFLPSDNPVRWMVPAALVFLPGFTDLMTAVNSDVGAVAFFSLFLWASLRMIRRGFSLARLVTTSLLAAACFWTKNTAAIALFLLIFPILFSLLRGRKQSIAWVLLGLSIPVSVFIAFTSGDVAYWYHPFSQNLPTRTTSPQIPLGSHAFQLDTSVGLGTANLIQLLSSTQVQKFRGKTVTLGYWIWANQPTKGQSPLIRSDQQAYYESIDITQAPTFHAFTAKIAGNTRHLQIILTAPRNTGVIVNIDGIVLVKGDNTQSGSPVFTDDNGLHGSWGGKSFENPIRNSSAERNYPRLRVFIQRFLLKISPLQPNMILASLADWQNSRWYYQTTAKQLLRTFWGQFGWGHIRLARNTYIVLSIMTVVGGLGGLVGFLRNRKEISWSGFALLAGSVLWIWGVTLVRGIHSISGSIFIPSARYAFPAIVPTVWLLCAGWNEWARLFERWLRIPSWVKTAVFLAAFLLLVVISIWTIVHFYGKL